MQWKRIIQVFTINPLFHRMQACLHLHDPVLLYLSNFDVLSAMYTLGCDDNCMTAILPSCDAYCRFEIITVSTANLGCAETHEEAGVQS